LRAVRRNEHTGQYSIGSSGVGRPPWGAGSSAVVGREARGIGSFRDGGMAAGAAVAAAA